MKPSMGLVLAHDACHMISIKTYYSDDILGVPLVTCGDILSSFYQLYTAHSCIVLNSESSYSQSQF